jgi:hypothetical protein
MRRVKSADPMLCNESQMHPRRCGAIPTMVGFPFVLTCCALLLAPALCVVADDSRDALRSRIAAISSQSAHSISGRFAVVGSNRLENVSLMDWCEDIADRIESLTGLPSTLGRRSVQFSVQEGTTETPGGVAIRHAQQGKKRIHRIFLRNYAAAYTPRGRQAICRVVLADYVEGPIDALLSLPPWLWKGAEQNLLPTVRIEGFERVLALWRAGKLISVWDLVGEGQGDDPRQSAMEGQDRLAAYGAFVKWLSVMPGRRARFRALFAKVASGQSITVKTLGPLVTATGDRMRVDEAWDRWLLRQRHIVYTPGAVSTRTVDQLRSELLIYPGACGIPLDVELPRRATMVWLVELRRRPWVSTFVRNKRQRLDLLAAGRSEAFQAIVTELGEFLSALESDAADVVLLAHLKTADAALNYLAERVQAAGGILTEPAATEVQN